LYPKIEKNGMGSGGYVAGFDDFGKTLYGAQSFEISEISELFHEQALFFRTKGSGRATI
jgi:hypothetical protein